MLWEHREPAEGLANPDEDRGRAEKRGRDTLRPVSWERQHPCLTKPGPGDMEMDDTGIKRGEILESSLPYIKTPSKVEARHGVERSVLARTEAIGERGGGVEVNILLATVVERNEGKCCGLLEKSGWKVLGAESRE